jgi:hypothetical protein
VTRRRRQILIGALTGALIVTLGGAGVHLAGATVPAGRAAVTGDGEMPSALGAHLARVRQAAPNGGVLDTPGALGQGEFDERAYPAQTISVAQVDRSRSAFAAADARAVPSGRSQQSRWANIGPSEALYPFTEFRNAYNYVPNASVAGGGPRPSRSASTAARASAAPTSPRPAAASGPPSTSSPRSRNGPTSAVRWASTRQAPSPSTATTRPG